MKWHDSAEYRQVLGKWVRSEQPETGELDEGALEAILTGNLRPAVPIHEGMAEFPARWIHLNASPVREMIRAASAAVGQLETPGAEFPAFAGSAFLIAPNLVVTTRHVVELFASGLGMRDLRFRPGREARVDFSDGGARDGEEHRVTNVVMVHPELDVAILQLESAASAPPLRMEAVDPGELEGDEVAVIGYPVMDSRYGREFQEQVFGGEPGIKRVMPGRVMKPRLVTSLGEKRVALTHDAITLGGRSGSPVVHLKSGLVVGVSFASQFLDANFAVPVSELAMDERLWALGLSFEGASRPTGSPWEDRWREADGVESPPPLEVRATSVVSASDAIRNEIEQRVAERFRDATEFRTFLDANGYGEVTRAVPESADRSELVRALDRRGALNDSFLKLMKGDRGLSPWLPQSTLSRVLWAVEPVGPQEMELYSIGSQWRDYLLSADGTPQSAAATVQRLAFDPRPEVAAVLAYLLRRLYESVRTDDKETLKAIREALRHVEVEKSEPSPAEKAGKNPPPMQSIAYLQRGIEAARSVVSVEIGGPAQWTGSTGWVLTPDLIVVPAHLLSMTSEPEAQVRSRQAYVRLDFDTEKSASRTVAVKELAMMDVSLDIALLRLREPIADRHALQVKPGPPEEGATNVCMIHHPGLGRKQYSHDGRILRHDGHDVVYLLDTAPGSAGAPVFDDQWRVLATHRAFTLYRENDESEPIRAKLGIATAALLGRLRSS